MSSHLSHSHSSHGPLHKSDPQVIEGQYLDQRKLVVLLRNVYGTSTEGKNNFRVELRLNRYKIYPSDHLSGMALTETDAEHLAGPNTRLSSSKKTLMVHCE
ncbi:hypothetical protein LOCC1_G005608 [Lachnellula occidentalis]|uniref:Uncharacterized protein n=1 Tax=Lachnellula occidentalis TaxID=215460 RepID=A0A8H8RYZ1_9HELO|nr:hypothetical protein LOCC1_G005608 [Lachnellula occidentalis]